MAQKYFVESMITLSSFQKLYMIHYLHNQMWKVLFYVNVIEQCEQSKNFSAEKKSNYSRQYFKKDFVDSFYEHNNIPPEYIYYMQ